MSWRKHFSPVSVNNSPGTLSPIGSTMSSKPGPARANYSSCLPEVYTGAPNRIERYLQYSTMDMDSEVNAALDILAEFCTETNNTNQTPFNIVFKNKATNSEVSILREYLQQWNKLQKFETRIFRIVRNTFKNGDSFFIRDPETFKWHHIDPSKLVKIIVNESEGKVPEQYVIKDLSPNFVHLVTTAINPNTTITNNRGTSYVAGGAAARGMVGAYPANPSSSGSRFNMGQDEVAIDANHVVHISLSEGLDNQYPFGNSLLETIFKVYKQKELLEDAILIYRIQRAPERRIFYIDVGNMPSHLAMTFVERVKNEIQQRRIPSPTGGGGNSIDSAFNPLCLDLSTKIPLLDGRTLELQEIISEYENGKQNWVYSCNPETGKIVPGVITWAGITRKNTETIKLTFDNGETLICTPDHKIPVVGKGFIEAKDISENDSLISFNRRKKTIDRKKTTLDYEQVWDHEFKKWIWTHGMVAQYFRDLNKHQSFTYLSENTDAPKNVIHHRDYNRFNNHPSNLTYMNKEDHILYHSSQKKDFWENMSDEYREYITSKISSSLKNYWESLSEQKRLELTWNFNKHRAEYLDKRKTDPVTKAKFSTSMSISQKEYITKNPEHMKKMFAASEGKRNAFKNQETIVTFDMLQIVAGIVKKGSVLKQEVLDICDNTPELLELVEKYNISSPDYNENKIDTTQFGYKKLRKLLSTFGYKNWKHFVKEIDNFNHKVVKIEKVNNRDTGTITVDGDEKYHNFHTFAIDSGIFVKNSQLEDFFLPVSADSRGSKVDVLPGGQNIGEITDLTYFTNKLFRALRIPSSYLPTGADDSQQQYTDGRVGTAYIQELRFNKYCIRLQTYMQTVFDQEFKYYLFSKGVNIDSSIFDLKFNPPQNFASYRQSELDDKRTAHFAAIIQQPIVSKRFAMKRYLGWSEEEIAENERMWAEENGESSTITTDSSGELRNVGISQSGIQADMTGLGDMSMPGMPPVGAGTPEAAGGQPQAGAEPEAAPQG